MAFSREPCSSSAHNRIYAFGFTHSGSMIDYAFKPVCSWRTLIVKAPAEVLPLGTKLVLLVWDGCMSDLTETFFVKPVDLAELCPGLTVGQVQDALRRAEKEGFLKRSKRKTERGWRGFAYEASVPTPMVRETLIPVDPGDKSTWYEGTFEQVEEIMKDAE